MHTMLWLWKISIRSLSYTESGRETWAMFVAHESQSERELVPWVKATVHSPGWWEEHLITDLEIVGKLWAITTNTQIPED